MNRNSDLAGITLFYFSCVLPHYFSVTMYLNMWWQNFTCVRYWLTRRRLQIAFKCADFQNRIFSWAFFTLIASSYVFRAELYSAAAYCCHGHWSAPCCRRRTSHYSISKMAFFFVAAWTMNFSQWTAVNVQFLSPTCKQWKLRLRNSYEF